MDLIIKLLKESKYCVALTGAGISTLSGIRDFRGKNGIYNQYNADLIFDLEYFKKDCSYYYNATRDMIYNLDSKNPNLVHCELARLESLGIVKSVITQNIDLLHTRAGSRNVIELHGSPAVHRCLNCGQTYSYRVICDIVQSGNIPRCDRCKGIIKPDITFFGEMLDADKLDKAVHEASKADLFLALGTSLLVQPAASLPLYTLKNGSLIIVNDMATPLDDYAVNRYIDLEEVFKKIEDEIV